MDVEIIDEEDNPMLHRTDVRFQLTHDDATPSRLSVRDSLAAKLNKGSEEVVVQKLDTKYGMRKTVGYAKVYDTAEAAQDVEQDHSLARNKITEDGAEPAEEPEPEVEEEADEPEADGEAEAEEVDEDAEAVDADADAADEEIDVEDEAEGTDEDGEAEAEEEAEADEEEAEAEAEEETEADEEEA